MIYTSVKSGDGWTAYPPAIRRALEYLRDTDVEAREAADTWFLESVPDESFVLARPGCVAVFFPWDAHRPGVALGESTTFRKCVVKVSMELLEQELPA